ncbi:MAG: radical SAM protein [Rickettsiales bacterium]
MSEADILEKPSLAAAKFRNPSVTADGHKRASVRLESLETLWFNTGTLCNLECSNCYIESSPTNDRLVYLTVSEVEDFLDELSAFDTGTKEIAFTGGEPFMNPDIIAMIEAAASRGHRVLVLSNAMRPMMKCADRLLALQECYGRQLTIRVSLDHYSQPLHDLYRGARAYETALEGLRWLSGNGFSFSLAGRTFWNESEQEIRDGFKRLCDREGLALDPDDPVALTLFPEMDESLDVPEITEACWSILGVSPGDMMWATSRIVVKRKGGYKPTVLPCTLLPYDREFELGSTLADAEQEVPLNHPHCARFCVLGGGSCSRAES